MTRMRGRVGGLWRLMPWRADKTSLFSLVLAPIRWRCVPATLMLGGVSLPSCVMAVPVAKVAASSHFFGVVREGDTVSHTFEISNAGDQPLTISRIVPGCGCTKVNFSTAPIQPGTSSPIAVSFSSSGFSGPVTSSIRVVVDDPSQGHIDLVLRGEVKNTLSVIPDRVLFPDVLQSRGSSPQEVVVTSTAGKKLSARSLSRAVRADVVADSGTTLRLAVKIERNAPIGELRERILVKETDQGGRSFSIPVFAIIKPSLQASQSTVLFSSTADGGTVSGNLLLNYFGDTPFGKPRFVFDRGGDGIEVKVHEVDPGRTWEISFVLDKQKASSSVRDRVIILGDDDDGPSASVRLVASKSR